MEVCTNALLCGSLGLGVRDLGFRVLNPRPQCLAGWLFGSMYLCSM